MDPMEISSLRERRLENGFDRRIKSYIEDDLLSCDVVSLSMIVLP